MPSAIGILKINSNGGTLSNGGTFIIAPTTSSKSYSGAGGGITGDFSATFTVFSVTLTNDPDVIDSSTTKVATGT